MNLLLIVLLPFAVALRHSMLSLGFFSNRWLIVGVGIMIVPQLLFTYLPAMNFAFGSQPIGLRERGLIIGASCIICIVIEFEK